MRISKLYGHHPKCDLFDCEKRYCTGHRLIFQTCLTAEWYTYRLIGGECPRCESDFRQNREERLWKQHQEVPHGTA